MDTSCRSGAVQEEKVNEVESSSHIAQSVYDSLSLQLQGLNDEGCKAGLEFKLPQGNEKTMDLKEVGQKVCDTSLICQ